MKKIDTCGLSCPQPVLMTKNFLSAHPEGGSILVDNQTARENVVRMCQSLGYNVSVEVEEDGFIIKAKK